MDESTAMHVIFSLNIRLEGVSSALLGDLLSIYPEGCASSNMDFECDIPLSDLRGKRLLDLLNREGFTRWEARRPRTAKEYRLYYRREYDASDFEAAQWLQPQHPYGAEWAKGRRRPDGLLELSARYFKEKVFFEGGGSPSFNVSRQVRAWLEEAGVQGMVFRPIRKLKGQSLANEGNLWELTTELILPKMSSAMQWTDDEGRPTQATQYGGFNVVEGFFIPAEFHYTRNAIAEAKDVDVALTWEHFGMPDGHCQEMLVSQRFYRVCRDHHLPMDWIPVRIDPD